MNKVKFGLSNVHIAKIIYGANNEITYDTVFAIPGAVTLTLDPSGEEVDFHADNTSYFKDRGNDGYSGSLELALVPDEFKTKILGLTTDANGALFENKDDKVNDFALGFQIDGDAENRKYWYYNVNASRPSVASKTREKSKEPVTETLNITASARPTDGQVKTELAPTVANKTAYDAFFESVYEKTPSA